MLFLNPMPRVRSVWSDKLFHPIAFIKHARETHKQPVSSERCNCFAAFFYIEIFETFAIFAAGAAIASGFTKGAFASTTLFLAVIAVLCKAVSLLSERIFGWEDWNNENRRMGKKVQHLMGKLSEGGDASSLLQDLLSSGVKMEDIKIERMERAESDEDPIDKIIRESQAAYRRQRKPGGDLPS